LHRCCNEKCSGFEYWGGRGIQVCPQWKGPGGFIQFLADMGRRPKGMTLDRKNPEGHYCPDNVRWGTSEDQANNKRGDYTEDELIEMRNQAEQWARTFEEQEAALGTGF
jgi:hypothetical protein